MSIFEKHIFVIILIMLAATALFMIIPLKSCEYELGYRKYVDKQITDSIKKECLKNEKL